jgi:pilus assembly protein Flp/PilA
MTNFITSARKFITNEDGPTMVEYGLLVALIAVVAAIAAATVGTNVKTLFTAVAGSI